MVLKHRDKKLLRFDWIGDVRVRIVAVNDAERRFLPIEFGDERRAVLSGFLQKRVSDIVRFGCKVDEKWEQSLVAESIVPNENVGVKSSSGSNLSPSEQKAALLILRNSSVTEAEIANQLGMTIRQVERIFAALKRKAGLRRRGSDKSGEWCFL